MAEKIERKKLTVKGMHCKSCEALITDSVMKIDGVSRFRVDYSKGRGEVEFNPEKTDRYRSGTHCPRSSMDQSAWLRTKMLGVRVPPWVPKVFLSVSPSWIGHSPTKRA